MKFSQTIQLNAPPEKIFPYLSDPSHITIWQKQLVQCDYVNSFDPAHPIGTKFICTIKEGANTAHYDAVVTDYEYPTRLGISMKNPLLEIRGVYFLTPIEGGTNVEYRAEMITNRKIDRLVNIIFRPFTAIELKRRLQSLKKVVETVS